MTISNILNRTKEKETKRGFHIKENKERMSERKKEKAKWPNWTEKLTTVDVSCFNIAHPIISDSH